MGVVAHARENVGGEAPLLLEFPAYRWRRAGHAQQRDGGGAIGQRAQPCVHPHCADFLDLAGDNVLRQCLGMLAQPLAAALAVVEEHLGAVAPGLAVRGQYLAQAGEQIGCLGKSVSDGTGRTRRSAAAASLTEIGIDFDALSGTADGEGGTGVDAAGAGADAAGAVGADVGDCS